MVVSIAATLIIGLAISTVIILVSVNRANDRIVSSMVNNLEEDNLKSIESLKEGFAQASDIVSIAEIDIRELVVELYENNYSEKVATLASQLVPLVENFDYDTAVEIGNKTQGEDDEIAWLYFAVSEKEREGSRFSFGQKLADDSEDTEVFEWANPEGDSYLKIEMQVSLKGLEGIENVTDSLNEIA